MKNLLWVRRLEQRVRRLSQAVRRRPPDESMRMYSLLREGPKGRIMFDVGAHHGSALAPFALDAWDVHAFEPDAINRVQLRRKWGVLPNVRIDPRALSDRPSKSARFFRSRQSTGLSALKAFHPTHEPAGSVEVITAEEYLREQGIDRIEFLKVDTEGYDLLVLKGMPWKEVRPLAVMCEFENVKSNPIGYEYHDLATFLQDQGYRVFVSEWYPVRAYGESHRWRRYSEYPTELEDPRAWGNLLALSDPALYQRFAKLLGLLPE